MIFDYENDREAALDNGILEKNRYGEIGYDGAHRVKKGVFRNFPSIRFEEVSFTECTFENCGVLNFDDCEVVGCTFENVKEVNGNGTDFTDSTFKNSQAEESFLSIDTRGKVDGCTFDSIACHGEEGFIVSTICNNRDDIRDVTNCNFTNCSVENDEEGYCQARYFKAFSSYKTIAIDNMDYDTCTGYKTAVAETVPSKPVDYKAVTKGFMTGIARSMTKKDKE